MFVSTLLSISMLAQAQEAPPPIVGGTTTTDFLPVGAILAYDERQGGFDFCSGTLITADFVVTAAHCIEAVLEYADYGYDIYFCTGSNLYTESGIRECDIVSGALAHPSYSSTTLAHDIGLMQLTAGLSSSGTYALNTDSPSTFSRTDEITYVGWGITGDNRYDSGRKRTVEVPLYTYDSQFIYTFDPDGERNICSGDSGGAALMWDDGDWELVGVNSFGFDINGGNPTRSWCAPAPRSSTRSRSTTRGRATRCSRARLCGARSGPRCRRDQPC